MPRTAFQCSRCETHLVWIEGTNNDDAKRFIAEHEHHAGGVILGEETDTANVFEFTHQVGLPS